MVFPLLLQFLRAFFFPTIPCLDLVLYLLLYLSRFRLILEKRGGKPCVWGFFHYLRPYLLHLLLLICHVSVSDLCLALLSPQIPPFPLIHFSPSFCWRVAWEKMPLSSEQSSSHCPLMLQNRWQKQSQQASLRETWRLQNREAQKLR